MSISLRRCKTTRGFNSRIVEKIFSRDLSISQNNSLPANTQVHFLPLGERTEEQFLRICLVRKDIYASRIYVLHQFAKLLKLKLFALLLQSNDVETIKFDRFMNTKCFFFSVKWFLHRLHLIFGTYP